MGFRRVLVAYTPGDALAAQTAIASLRARGIDVEAIPILGSTTDWQDQLRSSAVHTEVIIFVTDRLNEAARTVRDEAIRSDKPFLALNPRPKSVQPEDLFSAGSIPTTAASPDARDALADIAIMASKELVQSPSSAPSSESAQPPATAPTGATSDDPIQFRGQGSSSEDKDDTWQLAKDGLSGSQLLQAWRATLDYAPHPITTQYDFHQLAKLEERLARPQAPRAADDLLEHLPAVLILTSLLTAGLALTIYFRDALAAIIPKLFSLLSLGTVLLPSAPHTQKSETGGPLEAVVFAPFKAVRGQRVAVQVALYPMDEGHRAAAEAHALTSDSSSRKLRQVLCFEHVPYGITFDVRLDAPDFLHNSSRPIPIEWNGTLQHATFYLEVPNAISFKLYEFRMLLRIGSIDISIIKGNIEIVPQHSATDSDFSLRPNTYEFIEYKKRYLSYASEDCKDVEEIAKTLRAARIEYFADTEHIRQGADWAEALNDAMRECDALFLCWSQFANKSPWVKEEVSAFLTKLERAGLRHDYPDYIQPRELDRPPAPPTRPWDEISRCQFTSYREYAMREAARRVQPFAEYQDRPHTPEMVVIPPGEFIMGSHPTERGRQTHEGPRRKVTFTRAFAVGKFAVTVREWEAARARGFPAPSRPRKGIGGLHPVTGVAWDEAKAYTAWLASHTKRPYRLLSEAEWEYVCRAGTNTPFSLAKHKSGKTITTADANFCGTYPYKAGRPQLARKNTMEVGAFSPNRFEVFGMHGNVWEWVEDTYVPNYDHHPRDGTAFVSTDMNALRVIRGGSYRTGANHVRSAARGASTRRPDKPDAIGFRVACDVG